MTAAEAIGAPEESLTKPVMLAETWAAADEAQATAKTMIAKSTTPRKRIGRLHTIQVVTSNRLNTDIAYAK